MNYRKAVKNLRIRHVKYIAMCGVYKGKPQAFGKNLIKDSDCMTTRILYCKKKSTKLLMILFFFLETTTERTVGFAE